MRSSAYLGILFVLSLFGLIHGIWTQRWQPTESTVFASLHLEEPIGPWTPGAYLTIQPSDLPRHQQTVSRQFDWKEKGKSVGVSITSGLPGVVSVHTPDVCYLGVGYQLKSLVKQEKIHLSNDQSATMYVADFQKGETEVVRVRWCWTVDGNWQAPTSPRWHFAGAKQLYKLYIVHPLDGENDLTESDSYRKFIASFLPVLNRNLRSETHAQGPIFENGS